MNLISREAAIEEIARRDTTDGTVKVFSGKEIIGILNEQPTAERQGWIPCTVKYPDWAERVLVITTSHEYHVWDCTSHRGEGYFWEDDEGLYHNKYEVEAWLPLPEPYKEVK